MLKYFHSPCNPIFTADLRSEASRPGLHVWIGNCNMNCLREKFGIKNATRDGPWANPEFVHALCPEGLIAKIGRYDRRDAGAKPRGSGANPTVVYDRGHLGEEPAVWKGLNHTDCLRKILGPHAAPACGNYRALAAPF